MVLFTPLTIRDATFRNRLWVPPMNQWSALGRDGLPTTWHLAHYGQLAAGGAGLVMVESTAISEVGRNTVHDVGLWNEAQVEAWKPITDLIASCGAIAGVQICHSGRKGSTYPGWGFPGRAGAMPDPEGGWPILAPSPIPFDASHATPRELTTGEIDQIVADFASAAAHAWSAGFKVVELHAAHGYLIHQFLSPVSNHRVDEYGGTLENRARLLTRVVTEVRERTPEVLLFVRFSGTDWTAGGLTTDDIATLASWVRDLGVDLFDISSGGIVPELEIPIGPGYQVGFATAIRDATGSPVAAVGLITEAEQAEKIVASKAADAVFIGRSTLGEPHLPLRWAAELGADPDDLWPPQYERARRLVGSNR